MSAVDCSALGRRLVVGLAGPWPSFREASWLKQWRPGGVILFSRNVAGAEQLAALCACLHDLVPGIEIVADHEGGPVSQLAAAVGRPPAAWTLGKLDDSDLTQRVHAETGRRCRKLGVDRILAPCCDVLAEIHNPVIGSRAFGTVPEQVVRHVTAAVAGLREARIDSCLKHWPGHGGSRVDSHLDVSRIGDGAHVSPFLAGLRAGAVAVMVGHLYKELGAGGVPGSGSNLDLPATLDREWLQKRRTYLNRYTDGELRFYADDVTMGALRFGMRTLGVAAENTDQTGLLDPAEVSVSWLQAVADAGCDHLLIRGIPWQALPEAKGAPLADEPFDSPAACCPNSGGQDAIPDSDIYVEARQRAWEVSGVSGFAAPNSNLVWLDFTSGDRWEAVAGDGAGDGRRLAERLSLDFSSISRIDGRDLGAEMDLRDTDRLLITSHRPLTGDHVAQSDLADQLASGLGKSGHCLVMGHPSLAGDVGSRLQEGWAVSALYDTTVADYRGSAGET